MAGAIIAFALLAEGWPTGVDLVLDPGHPDALEVPADAQAEVLLAVSSALARQPAPGYGRS